VAPLTAKTELYRSAKDFADSENEGIKALHDVTNLKA
jgi:hypothetical protein